MSNIGKNYYTFLGKKNITELQKYLHEEVEFEGPLAKLKGKDAVIQANSNFMKMFNTLSIKTTFQSKDQAMVVYELDIPGVSDHFPGASLLTIQNGLIAKIQLFYDARPFVNDQKEIFK